MNDGRKNSFTETAFRTGRPFWTIQGWFFVRHNLFITLLKKAETMPAKRVCYIETKHVDYVERSPLTRG